MKEGHLKLNSQTLQNNHVNSPKLRSCGGARSCVNAPEVFKASKTTSQSQRPTALQLSVENSTAIKYRNSCRASLSPVALPYLLMLMSIAELIELVACSNGQIFQPQTTTLHVFNMNAFARALSPPMFRPPKRAKIKQRNAPHLLLCGFGVGG